MDQYALQEWMTGVCKQVAARLGAGGAMVALADANGKTLSIAAQYSVRPMAAQVGRKLTLDRCHAARFVLESGAPLALSGQELECQVEGFHTSSSMLILPLKGLDGFKGCILVWRAGQRNFLPVEIRQAARVSFAQPPAQGPMH